jgi:hypothetical protein
MHKYIHAYIGSALDSAAVWVGRRGSDRWRRRSLELLGIRASLLTLLALLVQKCKYCGAGRTAWQRLMAQRRSLELLGTHITCFTSTKVQILTPGELPGIPQEQA